jgi:hypothetical protein
MWPIRDTRGERGRTTAGARAYTDYEKSEHVTSMLGIARVMDDAEDLPTARATSRQMPKAPGVAAKAKERDGRRLGMNG